MNELNIDTFDENVINSPTPVLLDFWAPWCRPCLSALPIIDKLKEEFEDKVNVFKVNVDEQGELATKFGIFSIPCFIVFNKGVEVERFTGIGNDLKSSLKELVNKYL